MLFSLLIVIIHGMIPHSHQEQGEIGYYPSHTHAQDYAHHNNEHHHPDKSQNKEHDHNPENDGTHHFPFHFHHSVTEKFDFTQTNFFETLRLLHHVEYQLINDHYIPECIDRCDILKKYHKVIPPLILSCLHSGAIALRAPPVIA